MSEGKSREETPEEKRRNDTHWSSLGKKIRKGAKLVLHVPGP